MPVPSAVQNLPGLGATGATGSYTLSAGHSRYSSTWDSCCIFSTHHSIMSSFCCAVKPLNQALAVCVLQEILGRNHSPGFIRVRIHAHRSLYSGCEDLLSVHLPNPPTLHRTAFSVGEDLPVGY
jgi:hypothetical protein